MSLLAHDSGKQTAFLLFFIPPEQDTGIRSSFAAKGNVNLNLEVKTIYQILNRYSYLNCSVPNHVR